MAVAGYADVVHCYPVRLTAIWRAATRDSGPGRRGTTMELLVAFGALVALGIAAVRWGIDTATRAALRERKNWP